MAPTGATAPCKGNSPRLHQYSKSQPLSVGIFFARFPSENRNDVASVTPATTRFPSRFPQIPLSVISRDASARDATSSIFNDLQAAGSISNLVGRWGIGKRIGTVPEFTLVASAHSLMALRALAAQNYCSFSSFLFFDFTRFFTLRPHSERQLLR